MVCGIDGSLEYLSEGGAHVAVGVQEVLPCLSLTISDFWLVLVMAVVGTIK